MKKKLALGTWSWGNTLLWGYQPDNDKNLEETYKEALNKGFKFIDTADSYGIGRFNGRSSIFWMWSPLE